MTASPGADAGRHNSATRSRTNHYGCDVVFRISDCDSARSVAIAKIGLVAFDYDSGELTEAPAGVCEWMQEGSGTP